MSVNDPMMESKHHLPECTLPKGHGDCICGELRAAEQRVKSDFAKYGAGLTDVYVEVVTYADHLAAVVRREEELNAEWAAAMDAATEQAHRDALADFLSSVGEDDPVYQQGRRDALANLDAVPQIAVYGHDKFTAGVKAARDAVENFHRGSCRWYYTERRCTCGLHAGIDALDEGRNTG